jgi:hypothetical protein
MAVRELRVRDHRATIAYRDWATEVGFSIRRPRKPAQAA